MRKALVKQPFAHHLVELRARLFLTLISFILGSVIGYLIAKPLLTWLLSPLHQSVYYTSPTGGFNIIFSVSLLVGVLFTIPNFLYQSFLFIKPLLHNSVVQKAPLV